MISPKMHVGDIIRRPFKPVPERLPRVRKERATCREERKGGMEY
jgi:hypothetical protein